MRSWVDLIMKPAPNQCPCFLLVSKLCDIFSVSGLCFPLAGGFGDGKPTARKTNTNKTLLTLREAPAISQSIFIIAGTD
jgi:hypothetical protein